MKKEILIVVCFCITTFLQGQILTVNVTAGGLSAALTPAEKTTVTNLTVTGTIDATDFKTMRDEMTVLSVLDISGVTVAAYTGTGGTYNASSTSYPANGIPDYAFYFAATNTGKTSLTSITFPPSTTSIGSSSFDGCTGLTSLIIPGLVVSLGDGAFWGCTGLTSVYIPSSVTSMGLAPFSKCKGLITVDSGNSNFSSLDGVLFDKSKTLLIQCPTSKTGSYIIPSSVTSIEQEAFTDCVSLTSISIPSSVTTIKSHAFSNCTNLTSLTLPSSLTFIGVQSFYYCTGLTGALTIPSLVSSIGNYAFSYCTSLASVNIPSSVTSIGSYAFYASSGTITVDVNNPNYSSLNGVLYNKAKTTLIQGTLLSTYGSYDIPSSVTSIGPSAFSRCYELTAVTIPSSVTSIGSSAFWGCSKLTSVSIPSAVTTIGSYSFSGCTGLTSIYAFGNTPVDLSTRLQVFFNVNKSTCTLVVPDGSKTAYQGAVQWNDFFNIVEIGTVVSKTVVATAGNLSTLLTATEKSTVTNLIITGTIDARDFKTMRDNMPILATVDISGATVAGYTGTEGTAGTGSITYPANTIPQYAFYNSSTMVGKTSLTTITLPSSVVYIGVNSFGDCNSLASITIPSSVTSIAGSAFRHCDGLISVTLQEGITTIGGSAFAWCSSLTSITIPSSITTIERTSFLFCTSLATVVLQNGVTSIGESAFEGCTGLTSINIPSSVTSIGVWAFYECRGLTSINIPSSVTTIGDYAFILCSGLTGSLTIPDNVTLGSYVFIGCTGLNEFIVNPASLNYSAVNGVLYNKSQTNLIQYPGGKPGNYVIPYSTASIGGGAFAYSSSLGSSLTIPESVSAIGEYAFYYCIGLTEIYANEIIPVDLSSSDSVFAYINKTTCTLYVPLGSKTAYQSAVQWKDFNNIVEYFATDVELFNSVDMSIYPNPVTDYLRLKTGDYAGQYLRYQLYDINGSLLVSSEITGIETIIAMNNYISGTYLLKVTDKNKILKTFKILKN